MNNTVLTTNALSIGYKTRTDVGAAVRILAAALDLSLRPGELVCLLGPNGVGKSTLIRTLAGMQPPLAGRVMLAGTDMAILPPRDLARRLSVVLTERIDVGNLSAYALVALGRHPHTDWLGRLTPQDEAVVRWSIEAVGAVDLACRQVHELSDGERQRVLIARALAQEPAVLILDEPTAFLDLPRRVEIMRLLRRLAHTTGQAMLVSTHDLDLALRSADLLWLMAAGGTMHAGAPEDMILSGAFEDTFHSEGVAFDRQAGAFLINPQIQGQVALVGDGLLAHWTRRALERAGFAVNTQDAHKPLCVSVYLDHNRPVWQTSVNGTDQAHYCLYDLVRYVRNIGPGLFT